MNRKKNEANLEKFKTRKRTIIREREREGKMLKKVCQVMKNKKVKKDRLLNIRGRFEWGI